MLVEHFESLQLCQYASAAPLKAWSEDLLQEFENISFYNEKVCQVAIQCRPKIVGAHGSAQSELYTLNCELLVTTESTSSALVPDAIVTYDSAVSRSKGIRYATICNVLCLHNKTTDTEARSIKCDKVDFEFLDSNGKLYSERPYNP